MKSLAKSRPLGPYSGPANKRPKSETPLLAWFRASGHTVVGFARALNCDPKSVYLWMYGQVIPELVYAFKIESLTEGGVPVESWLGTELAQLQWKHIHCNWEKYSEDHLRNQEKYMEKVKRRRDGEDAS